MAAQNADLITANVIILVTAAIFTPVAVHLLNIVQHHPPLNPLHQHGYLPHLAVAYQHGHLLPPRHARVVAVLNLVPVQLACALNVFYPYEANHLGAHLQGHRQVLHQHLDGNQ